MTSSAYSMLYFICNTAGEQSGAPEALPHCPVPRRGTALQLFMRAVAQKGKKGLPANRQPLYKGACGKLNSSEALKRRGCPRLTGCYLPDS